MPKTLILFLVLVIFALSGCNGEDKMMNLKYHSKLENIPDSSWEKLSEKKNFF